ncbi:MAG: sulfotransferase [Bacteroidetes bacterium HLUCCA01]|nr:MAG: sulfotransferase [Bacteroidetes bacterium HLUCCA01]
MSFEKNNNLEEILAKVNGLLAPVEQQEMKKVEKPKYPNLLLIGCPRCGSTMFTQWAASLEAFSYPSNFLSRFYKAPYIGALIYNMVTKPEYQYRDEFADINDELKFSSAIGKTKGFKAPHEFWYFWREFIDFPDVPCSEEDFAREFDFKSLQKELALIQKAFGKPFLCKAKIVNWYLESMSEHIEDVIYLHMYRDPIAMTRSLLKARGKWTGNQEKWFSWKPREYPTIKNMDKYHQVAGQIYFIEKEILSKKKNLGNTYLSFSYEDLCNKPEAVYLEISNKIKAFNSTFVIPEYSGEKQFQISNPISEEDKHIEEAFKYFEDEFGKLEY